MSRTKIRLNIFYLCLGIKAGFAPKTAQLSARATIHYFSNILFDLGNLDLPEIIPIFLMKFEF